METKALKAAYQLAEMNHNADPKNAAKKNAYEKARSAYEQAAEAVQPEAIQPEQGESTPASSATAETVQKLSGALLGSSFEVLSIEQLEALLETKKAANQQKGEAEENASKEATEAATLAAKAEPEAVNEESQPSDSQDEKKNGNQA